MAKHKRNKYKGKAKVMTSAELVVRDFAKYKSHQDTLTKLIFNFQGTIQALKWLCNPVGVGEVGIWKFQDGSAISYSRFVLKDGGVRVSVRILD